MISVKAPPRLVSFGEQWVSSGIGSMCGYPTFNELGPINRGLGGTSISKAVIFEPLRSKTHDLISI